MRWRVGMFPRLLYYFRFSLAGPGGEVIFIRQTREETTDVGVQLWVQLERVVDVITHLLPRIEHDLFPSVVRVKRGDHSLDRIIEEHRTDTDADVKFETVAVSKERFKLTYGLALVVEYCPTAADPTRSEVIRPHLRKAIRTDDDPIVSITHGNWSRFRLDLLLNLAAEAIRIRETNLNLR